MTDLSSDYRDAVIAAADRADDPVDQLHIFSDALDKMPAIQAEFTRRRRDLIVQMRKDMTAQQVADEAGISRARLYAILAEGQQPKRIRAWTPPGDPKVKFRKL